MKIKLLSGIFSFLFLILIFAGSWLKINFVSLQNPKNFPVQSVSAQTKIAEPKELIIPKIGVDAQIDSVGLDESNNQPVPSTINHVSWYNLGARPGEIGSAVLAGHNVWTYGPAVFYRLTGLTVGDKIQIINADNQTLNFVVSEINVYDRDKFPIEKVYTASDREHLNLITCTGQYDKAVHDYRQRLVVFAVLEP